MPGLEEYARERGWTVTSRCYSAPVETGLRMARGFVTIDVIDYAGRVHAQVVARGEDGRVTDEETFSTVRAVEVVLDS